MGVFAAVSATGARYDKTLEECESFEEEFLYVMKNLPTFATRPDGLSDKFFDEFFEAAEFASLPAEDKKTYRKTMGTVNDYLNTIDYARKEGREEGQKTALEEIARRMLVKGYPVDVIVEVTTLSEEQIKSL